MGGFFQLAPGFLQTPFFFADLRRISVLGLRFALTKFVVQGFHGFEQ